MGSLSRTARSPPRRPPISCTSSSSNKPIALALGQRKHGTLGNDGDRKLVDAIRVVADPAARGRGVTIVANEEIHGAREVTKHNQRPGGFTSCPLGLLGTIETDRATF